jgi:hypothetical protein
MRLNKTDDTERMPLIKEVTMKNDGGKKQKEVRKEDPALLLRYDCS